MNILIIGARGFVGKELEKEFKNYSCVGTSSTGIKPYIKYDIMEDDIDNIIDNLGFIGPKTAIITSAITNIDKCFTDKSSYIFNVVNMQILIKKLSKRGFKVVFLSSDYVFDGRCGDYTEVSNQNPITEYGRHKTLIEKSIFDYSSNNVIVRLSKTVSNKNIGGHIFSEWYDMIQSNKDIVCIKGQKFVPTDVNDVTKAIHAIIQMDLKGIYNLVADKAYYRDELAKLFLEKGGVSNINVVSKEVSEFNFKDTRPLNIGMLNNKIKQDININFKSMDRLMEEFWNGVM